VSSATTVVMWTSVEMRTFPMMSPQTGGSVIYASLSVPLEIPYHKAFKCNLPMYKSLGLKTRGGCGLKGGILI